MTPTKTDETPRRGRNETRRRLVASSSSRYHQRTTTEPGTVHLIRNLHLQVDIRCRAPVVAVVFRDQVVAGAELQAENNRVEGKIVGQTGGPLTSSCLW